jgi:hypothetical protein
MQVAHLYKITHQPTGYYYYGKHNGTTQDNTGTMLGLYWGSGKAVKDLITKYGKKDLTYDILCIGSTEYIFELESKLVTKELIQEKLCLNLCEGGLGSAMKSPEARKAHSERMKGRMVGDLNPSKRPEVREKISKMLAGERNPMYGRPAWNKGTKGITFTEEILKRLSELGKKVHKFTSPEGVVVERLGMQAFKEEFGLNPHGLYMVNIGKYKHHKGWRKA